MSELLRLLDDEATEFERALLGSAANDRGSAGARDRAVRAAAAAALVSAPAFGVAAAPTGVVVPVLVKWGAAGVLLGTVVASGTRLLHPAPELPRGARAVPAVSSTVEGTAPGREVRSAAVAAPGPEAAHPALGAELEPVAPSGRPERAVTPVPTREGSLAAEVAMLREARAALAAGDGTLALRTLERHRSSFASPALEPEATLLYIEALLLTGARGPARALAQRFLAQHPTGPHADRARELLERAASVEVRPKP